MQLLALLSVIPAVGMVTYAYLEFTEAYRKKS